MRLILALTLMMSMATCTPVHAVDNSPIGQKVAICDADTPSLCGCVGATPVKVDSAASTNATSVKATVGLLCSVVAINTTATLYYLKFYNTAAAPTCNSDTVVQKFPVPASTSGGPPVQIPFPDGMKFTTGIGLCLTGGIADNDNTNAATGVAISLGYK